ncbi:VOC family protein [Salinirubellus sp. GCM10025818]|uniref:VOC family protein n=1 Tax=Salinirubellus TaxID=2162630 RepID=UPI0030CE5C18
MVEDTPGIHHVTGIVGDAQPSLDFYADVLGLRLVKRTVNHEDILRHHLYYGNGTGALGSLFTAFPYPGDPPGRVGKPQVAAVGFAVPPGSLDYWASRLEGRGVDPEYRERFDGTVLRFEDPDGTHVELVAGESPLDSWESGPVPAESAIRGIHGVTVLPTNPYATASTLKTLGFDLVGEEPEPAGKDGAEGSAGYSGTRVRYRAPGDAATVVDLLDRDVAYGREGPGTLHHVAVRVGSEAELFEWHDLFRERDYHVSRVRDRIYYRSIYVRGPGGVLFELATEGPGLAVDEPGAPETMGESLVLPDWAEEDREMIESQLPPISPPRVEST